MPVDFTTTKWSLLIRIKSEDKVDAEDALNHLCQNYWLPLYAWLRGQGRSAVEAEDITQGFFAHAIRREIFQKADAEKGRLRSFLLKCLRNYLSDLGEKEAAKKRAGQAREIPILDCVDSARGEEGIVHDLASRELDPARLYERRWARAILQKALSRLREEHEEKGKSELYRALAPLLSDLNPGQSYSAVAQRLRTSEGAARIAFHRLKLKFREVVREEVARTLLPGDNLDEEMRYLAEVLS